MDNKVIIQGHMHTVSAKTVNKNGRSYEYFYTTLNLGKDPITGKQKQRTITAKTKEKLVEKLEDLQGTPVYSPSAFITLSEWLETWLHVYVEKCLKPTTISSYRYEIKKYINPSIGNILLKDIDEQIISSFYISMEKSGHSTSSILCTHRILSSALRYAACKKYILFNPCDTVPIKKRTYNRIPIFTPSEAVEYTKLIKNTPYENILGILSTTGMRISEAIGLSWDCIDMKARHMTIQNQIVCFKDKNGYKKYLWQESTKNNVTRTLYIGDDTMNYLTQQKEKQNAERLYYGPAWKNEHNLVFTMPNGRFLKQDTIRNHFKDVVTLLGRPELHVHSLRHTVASVAWDKTHDIHAVQELLGHNNPRTTAYYTQTLENSLIEQSRAVENYWNIKLSSWS